MTVTITRDMIDYEADGSATVTVDGLRYHVALGQDTDSTPFDADCYSAEDIEAWRGDCWEFVGVVVTPLSVPQPDQRELEDSLWGLEFGSYVWNRGTAHEGDVTTERLITQYPVPDMINEVARMVAAWQVRQAIQSYIYS